MSTTERAFIIIAISAFVWVGFTNLSFAGFITTNDGVKIHYEEKGKGKSKVIHTSDYCPAELYR